MRFLLFGFGLFNFTPRFLFAAFTGLIAGLCTIELQAQSDQVYNSIPAPESSITLGNSEVGTPTTTTPLIVLEVGEMARHEITGEHATDFQLVQGAPPFSIADDGSSHTILLQCTPSASGLRTAELILTINDTTNRRIHYSLTCQGNNIPVPRLKIMPAPETTIDFGATPIGTPIRHTIEISNAGEETLDILSAEITGVDAAVFELITPSLPFSLTLNNMSQSLVLECLPTAQKTYSAQLALTTNDSDYLTVTYPLTCLGEINVVPRLDTTPPPNTVLTFGRTAVDSTITHSILFQASDLVEEIAITAINLTGSHADDFTVIYGSPPLSMTANQPEKVMIIQCRPREEGIHRAFLSLTIPTLEPAQWRYTLHCIGESANEGKITESIFSGEIRTQAGAIGDNLRVHEPEQIKITGLIQPAHSHLTQLADLTFIYHWTPVGGKTASIPITFARQVPLATAMDWVLFEGYPIGFAGNFQLELGYRLKKRFYSQKIAYLEVMPNQMPTDILLDNETVAENSPAGTVIGSFTTVDVDRGDWFFYGLTDNPSGYFTIIGNELQVANGAVGLDYETAKNYPITVRSVDASGSYFEKSFTIQLTDKPATPAKLRLTNQYVLEQSPTGTAVARLITDSRERANYQYELIDDAEGRFYLVDDILLVADGPALDFESQQTHEITVRSQATETEIEAQIEETFTIEVINIIDSTVTSEIRDANDLILSTVPTQQPVNITVHLTPDIEHRGQVAEIITVVAYFQAEQLIGLFAVNEAQQWQVWEGDLLTLPGYQPQTLPEQIDFLLYQGRFPDELAGSRLAIYVGYRLATGELIYSPQLAIMVNFNGETRSTKRSDSGAL